VPVAISRAAPGHRVTPSGQCPRSWCSFWAAPHPSPEALPLPRLEPRGLRGAEPPLIPQPTPRCCSLLGWAANAPVQDSGDEPKQHGAPACTYTPSGAKPLFSSQALTPWAFTAQEAHLGRLDRRGDGNVGRNARQLLNTTLHYLKTALLHLHPAYLFSDSFLNTLWRMLKVYSSQGCSP